MSSQNGSALKHINGATVPYSLKVNAASIDKPAGLYQDAITITAIAI